MQSGRNDINVQLQNSRKYDRCTSIAMVHVLRADSQIQRIGALGPMRQVRKPAAGSCCVASTRRCRRCISRRHRANRSVRQALRQMLTDRIGRRMCVAPRERCWPTSTTNKREDPSSTRNASRRSAPRRASRLRRLRKLAPGEKVGTILEMVAARDDVHTTLSLIHVAIHYYRQLNAQQIEAAASDPVFVALYERALFLKRNELPFSLANPLKYRFPDTVREIKKWHLSYGDSEGPYYFIRGMSIPPPDGASRAIGPPPPRSAAPKALAAARGPRPTCSRTTGPPCCARAPAPTCVVAIKC